ncbi:multiple stress resistance protein BhsA [Providencia huaxiensis]|uniref:multiple stress resistance protein BhsA n=1 Tax=Providencia huaxiensis TaxID=2027290 RepID=UPI002FE03316
MKKSTLFAAALVLGAVSFGSMAAEEVQHTSQPATGYVSVTGAVSVNDLTAQLAKKADEAGATSFRVISAGGENSMSGTAAIYK